MAITSGASTGIEVVSAAKNGTLGSQAAAGDNEIIFDTAITTNNSGLEGAPTFVGRMVIKNQGLGDEEIRYIFAIAGDNVTATVHEDWVDNPVSADTYHVSYVSEDMATVTGFSLLSKRNTDYGASRNIWIGNGTDFAFFSLTNGYSIEGDSSITPASQKSIGVRNNAWLQVGYLYLGSPISAGYFISTGDADNDVAVNVSSGGWGYLYDFFFTAVENNTTELDGTVVWNEGKSFGASYLSSFAGTVEIRNVTVEGKGTVNETIAVDASTDIDGFILINTNGLITPTTSGAETIEIKNVSSINNLRLILVEQDKTWNIVNPIWSIDTTTQNDISFNSSTNNSVNEKFSLDIAVEESDGTPVQEAQTYVYEGLTNQDLPADNRQDTDANGEASSNILKRTFTDGGANLTVVSYDNFALKVYKYGFAPFVTAANVSAAVVLSVVLIPDTTISEAEQATAISNGSGITVTHAVTNAATLLSYDNGTINFEVDDVVDGQTSGAQGTVVKVEEGDTTSGRLFLKTRNSTAFVDNENLLVGTEVRALVDLSTGEQLSYSWWVDCNNYSMLITYGYLTAKIAEDTPDAIFIDAITWGAAEQTLLMYNAGGFDTQKVPAGTGLGEGIFLTNRGGGTIEYLTADDGTQYVPPVTYTHTLTNIAEGSEVTYVKVSDQTELYHVESVDAGGQTQYNYTYAGQDTIVDILIFHVNYTPESGTFENVTLTNADATLRISQVNDPNYSNP